ncbi:MAG: zinc ribbon domain-containing protein [Flavobacteriales bacterium]
MNKNRFTCSKCSSRQYSSGEVRTTGGFWSKIFNIQNRKFITISCEKCGYTEFYNQKGSSTAENILDLFTN